MSALITVEPFPADIDGTRHEWESPYPFTHKCAVDYLAYSRAYNVFSQDTGAFFRADVDRVPLPAYPLETKLAWLTDVIRCSFVKHHLYDMPDDLMVYVAHSSAEFIIADTFFSTR